jgi:glutaredoxin
MRASVLMMAAAAGLALAAATVDAQTIRCWTNPNGARECSDLPPPPHAKDVKDIRGRAGRVETQEPFVLKQARERFPVTLWINDCGEPCSAARSYLQQRGVPFTERDPTRPDQIDEFRKVTGGAMQVPVLQVGNARITGFEEGQWATTLDAAGYPRTPLGPNVPAPARAQAKGPVPPPAAAPGFPAPGLPGQGQPPGSPGAGAVPPGPPGAPGIPQPTGQPAVAPPAGGPPPAGPQPPGFTTTPGPIPPPR